VNHKTLEVKLARSKDSKRTSLRWSDDIHHIEPEDHHRDAFNKGTTPEGDANTSIGLNARHGRRDYWLALPGLDMGPQA
jgi:hypothetical protein